MTGWMLMDGGCDILSWRRGDAMGLIYSDAYDVGERDLVYRWADVVSISRSDLGWGGIKRAFEGGCIGGGGHGGSDAFIRVYRCRLVHDLETVPSRSRYKERRAVVFSCLFCLVVGWRCIIIIFFQVIEIPYLTYLSTI